ncbi:MAG: phosphoenolpyruvate--protein phosphotransferase [Chlorobiales bacterium]|jgi:phosphoenolpyruvate-protein phosphotransferase (PTS system enzyme I)|nr:phosphoenolpyruvate--protein phosphotransferase [Chlorobiales bacterium]
MVGIREIQEADSASQEQIFSGLGASKGIAIGKIYLFQRNKFTPDGRSLPESEIENELDRLKTALDRSEKELRKIQEVTVHKIGEVFSDIFSAQIMMLHDEVLIDNVCNRIREEKKYADTVIDEEITKYEDMMLSSSDSFLRERAADIEDLKDRIIRNLHSGNIISRIPESAIVVSNSLTPADIVLFSRQNVLGCATDGGGLTSHVALICRSLDIPMIVGLHSISDKVWEGQSVIIDGYDGKLYLNPNPQRLIAYERRQMRKSVIDVKLSELAEMETRTKCGKRIHIYSNIDFQEELPSVEKYGSEGIGLYRSESLFISRGKAPSEEEQYAYYSELARGIAPRPLTIRLFDVGGDKLLYTTYKEQNPNLGWRGIRILIDVPEILEAQLRAILRANTSGNIRILLPMISSIDEIRFIKKALQNVRCQLREEHVAFNAETALGVMIEIPSAVEIISEIVREVNFVSIGTNDLIQYTLAVDRNNDVVQDLYQKFHPAIIRMIARVIRSSNKAGCSVSICGEMAADTHATPLLLGFGLEEFSVVNSSIPELKKEISSYEMKELVQVAQKCLELPTASEVEHELKHFRLQYK